LIETIGKSETYRAFIVGPPGLNRLGLGSQIAGKIGWKYLNMSDWTKKEQEVLKVKHAQQVEEERVKAEKGMV
jgi:predicted transcriptional regulator with HTH domain